MALMTELMVSVWTETNHQIRFGGRISALAQPGAAPVQGGSADPATASKHSRGVLTTCPLEVPSPHLSYNNSNHVLNINLTLNPWSTSHIFLALSFSVGTMTGLKF